MIFLVESLLIFVVADVKPFTTVEVFVKDDFALSIIELDR
jgi:hypothetical protein